MDESIDPAEPDQGKRKSRITKNIFLAILVGLAINAFMGFVVDSKSLFEAIRRVGPWDIIAPFATGLVVYAIDTFRFRYLFSHFKIRLAHRDSLYVNLIGFFFSGITPSSAGGQPFQVYQFTRMGIDSTVSTNIVFSRLMVSNLAQLSIILAVALMGKGFSIFSTSGIGGFILAFGLAVTLGAFALLFMVLARPIVLGRLALRLDRSRLGRLIGRMTHDEKWAERFSAWSLGLGDSFKHLWTNRIGVVLLDLCLHALDQAIWALGLYLPFTSLSGSDVPFLPFLFAFNLCGLVSAFVPTPGASGSIEATYAIVLGGLAVTTGSVLPAIILWRFGAYYLHLLLGGLAYAFWPVAKDSYEKCEDGIVRHKRHRRAEDRDVA